jgi:hypothetical protein
VIVLRRRWSCLADVHGFIELEKPPRALKADELDLWFELRSQDERAVRGDLFDMSKSRSPPANGSAKRQR